MTIIKYISIDEIKFSVCNTDLRRTLLLRLYEAKSVIHFTCQQKKMKTGC